MVRGVNMACVTGGGCLLEELQKGGAAVKMVQFNPEVCVQQIRSGHSDDVQSAIEEAFKNAAIEVWTNLKEEACKKAVIVG
jgi:hypothetical protein